MQKYLGIALAGLAALAAVQPQAALGQGSLDRRLAAAKRIECSFSVLATGTWDKNVPAIAVTPSELKAAFFDINVDEGHGRGRERVRRIVHLRALTRPAICTSCK